MANNALTSTLPVGFKFRVLSLNAGPIDIELATVAAGGVTSFNGRTGAVVPAANDYAASQVANDSGVTGATVKDALETLLALAKAQPVNTYVANTVASLADAGAYVRMNVGAGNSFTVPLNATVAFPLGTVIRIVQAGAGVTSLIAAGGVTLNVRPSVNPVLQFAERYAQVCITKVGADTWDVEGGLLLS